LVYFRVNWLNCIEKWTKFKRRGLPLNLQETNNPVETVNNQVKEFSKEGANSSIGSCLRDAFVYIKNTELQCRVNANKAKNQSVQMQYGANDSVVNDFYKFASKNMAHWLFGQYRLSSTIGYAISECTENCTKYVVTREDSIYTISNLFSKSENAQCSCYENLSLDLPCRHIFFALKSLNLPIFSQKMVPDRHNNKLDLVAVQDQTVNLISSVPNMNDVRSMIKPNMTEKAKYSAAFRIAQELVNNMKRMKQIDFENHLKNEMHLSDLIAKRVDYVVLPIESENDKNDKTLVHGDNLTDEIRQSGDIDDELNNSLSSQASQLSVESTTSTQSSKDTFNLNEKRIVNGI
jgi:hypothetical protein